MSTIKNKVVCTSLREIFLRSLPDVSQEYQNIINQDIHDFLFMKINRMFFDETGAFSGNTPSLCVVL